VKRLLGKYALVTGGSSGIGAACARALADEGAAVLAGSRRLREGGPHGGAPVVLPNLGEVGLCHLDVTDEAEVRDRVDALPELDLLVCAAGIGTFTPIARTTVAELREMLEVHVVGTLVCVREALRRMQPRRRGHIVLIGSHVVHEAFADCAGYTAAKMGQLGLARVLATEARPYDIRVTSLLAGATDTPIWDDRPGFDRAKMMRPEELASFMISIVARPGLSVEEVVVRPPAGAL
jgi:NAD(P)-dependent dehydrogenase (short-subunit alcohol dehydrogenase family)